MKANRHSIGANEPSQGSRRVKCGNSSKVQVGTHRQTHRWWLDTITDQAKGKEEEKEEREAWKGAVE